MLNDFNPEHPYIHNFHFAINMLLYFIYPSMYPPYPYFLIHLKLSYRYYSLLQILQYIYTYFLTRIQHLFCTNLKCPISWLPIYAYSNATQTSIGYRMLLSQAVVLSCPFPLNLHLHPSGATTAWVFFSHRLVFHCL